jgi:hypothetical protein
VNTLVVPTNRPDALVGFLDAWSPWPWDRLIVVCDGPDAVDVPRDRWPHADRLSVLSWRDVETLPDPSIISRRDSAIRSFGFWEAWRGGADVIFTLDDDCYPADLAGDAFVGRHLDNLFRTARWESTVPGLRVRGLPYRNLGVADVLVSVGLWVGTPDLDAVQTLAGDDGRGGRAALDRSRWVMPSSGYFPMSGMNLAFRREAACLMYFAPMGLGQPYRRFDDIWCGLVVQRVCRHLEQAIVCGQPVVDHRRASDPFANLVKEAPGIQANESMWERIDELELKQPDALGCMREVGEQLSRRPEHDGYLEQWGRSILGWCELFEADG